jgi:hypothetical protein
MKKYLLIFAVIISGCVSDPVGIHRFNIINKTNDTFYLKVFIESTDSVFSIKPNDTTLIWEAINNSNYYSREEEAQILGSFDSLLLINDESQVQTNISDYKIWQFNQIEEDKFNVASSDYIIK